MSSINDSYHSNKCCMLEELFKHNKLEYVHILTEKGKNIIFIMLLNKNIENLRYFYVYLDDIRYEVTLDI